MAKIGFVGALSFIVRFIFNFQLSVVFVADATIYVLRRIQKEAERDEVGDEYERALAEFDALDVRASSGFQAPAWLRRWFVRDSVDDDDDDGSKLFADGPVLDVSSLYGAMPANAVVVKNPVSAAARAASPPTI